MTELAQAVALPNGLTLPYVEQGDRSGVPVVLLHGVTDSWRSFEPVLPLLPGWLHVFAVTQRGHGDASRPAAGYRFHDFAADLAAFMDALGLESAVVAGHSMGASVAQRFAIDHPDRVRGLVLAGAFAGYRDNPAVTEFWEGAVSRLADPIDPHFVREFQKSTLAAPIGADFLEAVVEESLKVPARVWRAAFAAFLADDTAREMDKIAAPALLVWGDEDAFCTRRDQDTLLGAIADARLAVYRGVGHAIHWEWPARFAADLATFTDLVAGPRR